jgi:hypothetical protein
MKTSVLLSSIFFIALSVVSGNLSTEKWSSLFARGADRRGYLGCRLVWRVLGRKKCTLVRMAILEVLCTPLLTASAAFFALAVAAVGAAACAHTRGARRARYGG